MEKTNKSAGTPSFFCCFRAYVMVFCLGGSKRGSKGSFLRFVAHSGVAPAKSTFVSSISSFLDA